jgi:hypothetical protein
MLSRVTALLDPPPVHANVYCDMGACTGCDVGYMVHTNDQCGTGCIGSNYYVAKSPFGGKGFNTNGQCGCEFSLNDCCSCWLVSCSNCA